MITRMELSSSSIGEPGQSTIEKRVEKRLDKKIREANEIGRWCVEFKVKDSNELDAFWSIWRGYEAEGFKVSSDATNWRRLLVSWR